MKELKELIQYLIGGIISRELSHEDILTSIKESDTSDVYKKGLLSLLEDSKIDSYNPLEVLFNISDFCENINGDSKRVGIFEKVSFLQFSKDTQGNDLFKDIEDTKLIESYENIKLPCRSSKGSAGYDFVTPVDITLKPGESTLIPSGIRCCMLENWVLMGYVRSGLGTKYRVQMDNTTPVIDSDYYYSDNEGHIMFKITNDSKEGKVLELKAGERFCQCVFMEYGITIDDSVDSIRNGGFGSSGK